MNYKIRVENEVESKEARYKIGLRKVCGIGINDIPGVSNINNPDFWKYKLWKGMITRCFSAKIKQQHETYIGVSCDDSWLVFSKFISDALTVENVKKYLSHSWHLDKDILVKGNKLYSLNTVCFVPSEINNLLISSKKTRGCLPVGLSIHKGSGKIQVRVSKGGKNLFLGKFDNLDEAFHKYKVEKEEHIKFVARKWEGVVADNVFNALMNYEVSIDD